MGNPATDGGLYLWQLRRGAADGDVPVFDAATGRFFPNPANAGQPCSCLDSKITEDLAVATTPNFDPANWVSSTLICLTNSSGAAATITGLSSEAGAPTLRDRVTFLNVDPHGTDPVLFSHLDGLSLAINQMYFPTVAPAAVGTFALGPRESLTMVFERTNTQLWMPF